MIEETVRVVEEDGDYVWVEATSRSACSGCGSQGGCGTSVLGGLFKQHTSRLRVVDHLSLRVGESAVLGMDERDLAKAAFYVYLVPVLLMVATCIGASTSGLGDSATMLLGIVGLAAGFKSIELLGRHLPGGLVKVSLLRRAGWAGTDTIQFINLERKTP